MINNEFWKKIMELVGEHEIIIDRKRGSLHPRRSDIVYPLDYGYLSGTSSMDGEGIDIWVGSLSEMILNGIICTIDSYKMDSEVKIIVSCTDKELETVYDFVNSRGDMKGIFIKNTSL